MIVNLFAWQLFSMFEKSCLRQFLTMSAFAVSVTGTVSWRLPRNSEAKQAGYVCLIL